MDKAGLEALAASRIVSNILGRPSRSCQTAYGRSAEVALHLDWSGRCSSASAIVLSFAAIRLETSSTRVLVQGQNDSRLRDGRTHLSSKVVNPVSEISQPKSVAMIDRQSAMAGFGGRG